MVMAPEIPEVPEVPVSICLLYVVGTCDTCGYMLTPQVMVPVVPAGKQVPHYLWYL